MSFLVALTSLPVGRSNADQLERRTLVPIQKGLFGISNTLEENCISHVETPRQVFWIVKASFKWLGVLVLTNILSGVDPAKEAAIYGMFTFVSEVYISYGNIAVGVALNVPNIARLLFS